MVTSYRSIINPNEVCISLRFDKEGHDWKFWAICEPIKNGDECAAIEEMARRVEIATSNMVREGYQPHESNAKIELCPSSFERFVDKASFFGEVLAYLTSKGIEVASEEVSSATSSFWSSMNEFFSTAIELNSKIRQYNRDLGVGYWGSHF